MSKLKLVPAALLALSAVTCEEVPLTAPVGSTIFLVANPPFVAANGGRSIVTAVVTEPAGTFAPDGTNVFFFTDLGRIDSPGLTVNGQARVNFVADARSGTANITAISGGPAQSSGDGTSSTATGTGSATITISIGSSLPTRVVVGASPQRITSSRQSTITANVFDEFGNPVQNVPVVFSIGGSLVEETLESGGAPRYTDSNGQAFDVLRTRAPVGGIQKTVTVTATTANGVDGTITVYVD
jgi:hypothetical protein